MKKVIKLATALIILSFQVSALKAQPWTVNPGDYEFSMNVTGQVSVEGTVIDQQNSYLGAFVNNECRGIAMPTSYEGNYKLFLISIYSNVTEGETLVFKLMDEASQEFSVANEIRFVSDAVYGSADEPFLWMDVEQYASTDFLSFALNSQVSSATIDATNRNIEILVSAGTDRSNLIPTFTLAPGAVAYIDQTEQVSNQTTNDYTEIVSYTVIGVDNITANWVVEVNLDDNIGIENYTKNEFEIYPNPVSSYLQVENGNLKVHKVEIIDITGKTVKKLYGFENLTDFKINLSNLKSGCYFIKIDNSIQKFIKK